MVLVLPDIQYPFALSAWIRKACLEAIFEKLISNLKFQDYMVIDLNQCCGCSKFWILDPVSTMLDPDLDSAEFDPIYISIFIIFKVDTRYLLQDHIRTEYCFLI